MKTILFTNARDEANIAEWVKHHQLLGFTQIVIFDHKSIEPIFIKLQNSNINMNNVYIIRLDQDIVKLDLMKFALKIANKQKYDWLLYLDCDEFLVLNKDMSISKFARRYMRYYQVGINWLLFGSNYREKILTPEESIIQTYTRSDPSLDLHIKSFLNIRKARRFRRRIQIMNPHFYDLNQMKGSINVNYRPLNKVEPYFYNTKENFRTITAFVAHYMHQSYEEYIKRKVRLPRDDILGLYRPVIQPSEFHEQNNSIINTHVSDKYHIH